MNKHGVYRVLSTDFPAVAINHNLDWDTRNESSSPSKQPVKRLARSFVRHEVSYIGRAVNAVTPVSLKFDTNDDGRCVRVEVLKQVPVFKSRYGDGTKSIKHSSICTQSRTQTISHSRPHFISPILKAASVVSAI